MVVFRKKLLEYISSNLGMKINAFQNNLESKNDECTGVFMELDSSNVRKFSRHVIVTLPNNKVFPSNYDVKM